MTIDELIDKLKERHPAIHWAACDQGTLSPVPYARPDYYTVTARVDLRGFTWVTANTSISQRFLDDEMFDAAHFVAQELVGALARALLSAKPSQLEVK